MYTNSNKSTLCTYNGLIIKLKNLLFDDNTSIVDYISYTNIAKQNMSRIEILDDIDGMKSLIFASNLPIIKKLFHLARDETIDLMTKTLISMTKRFCDLSDISHKMINFILDHINPNKQMLDWIFQQLVKKNVYSVCDKPFSDEKCIILNKLIDMGASAVAITIIVKKINIKELIYRGLISMPNEIFIKYIEKNNIETDTNYTKYIFMKDIDKKNKDYLYNKWKSLNGQINIDDMFTMLSTIFDEYNNNYKEHENIINELIPIAYNQNF